MDRRDDDTTVFTQRDRFRLVTDHHIQTGPKFPQPLDVLIDMADGKVTVRSGVKGKEKVESSHIDLPPDLANGVLLNILKNIHADTRETKVSYLAATPKPRLVKLSIVPGGVEPFSIAETRYKAERFVVKVDLGGVVGMIAPLIGKQPADTDVWIALGQVPAFVKSLGPLSQDGPVFSIEMTSPVWSFEAHSSR